MTDKKDPKDPSVTSAAWDDMIPKWEMIETLLAGTQAMREAETRYLPQHEEESDSNYMTRLNATTLFNMTELTLNTWVGKPFSDPVKLNDDVPPAVEELTEDIDLQGNDITTFCRDWFREGLAKGVAHVLIDFPSIAEEERIGRTRADDLAENRRPYWVLVKPENLFFAHSVNINGEEVLDHIRIRETVSVMDGFTEVFVERIRVLFPGGFQLFELRRTTKRSKPEWVLIESGTTDLDFIPLVSFYADRQGLMLSKPPLEDLAFLNVRHWQSTSDQINVITVARFPMLAVAGAHDASGAAQRIGPKQLLGTRDANGRFYYVEHTGKAIGSGKEDLERLEDLMASYGAEFMRRRPGNLTATAKALDSAEATSPLQDFATRFIDAVNTALAFTAAWLKIEDGGTVEILTDFGPEEINNIDLQTLNFARGRSEITSETYLTELLRRGMFADDFDPAAEAIAAEKEQLADIEKGILAPAEGPERGTQEGDEGTDDASSASGGAT